MQTSIAQLTCLPSNSEERFLLTPLREFRGRVSFGENSIEFSIEVSTTLGPLARYILNLAGRGEAWTQGCRGSEGSLGDEGQRAVRRACWCSVIPPVRAETYQFQTEPNEQIPSQILTNILVHEEKHGLPPRVAMWCAHASEGWI